MKLTHVTFNNFKPYYGEVSINLDTKDKKNIVLIGGRNGQGKTSFLVGVVWCLYGHNISDVDKAFRDEVKGNYTKFLTKSLNKTAYSEGKTKFSVEVGFKDVELSDVFTKSQQQLVNISIKRSFDLASNSIGESFDILMDGEPNALLSDDTDKIHFINDYLIPIDLAKFVFFDAEKIAEIAQLGAKKQASLMDEAFGQVLGLNIYENLIEDLIQYEKNQQKEAAPKEINLQISSFEKARESNQIQHEITTQKLNEIEEKIEELKTDITEYTNQLIRRGDSSIKVDMKELQKKEVALAIKQEETAKKFNEMASIIPLAIMADKIEEVHEQINKEEAVKLTKIENKALIEKTKEFAELLFNKPPFPENDIDLEQKHFYYNKAKALYKDANLGLESDMQFEFEHDMDKSDITHVNKILNIVKTNNKAIFESIFNDYMRIKNDYQEIDKELRIAASNSKDEFIQEIQDKKNQAEREKSKLEQEKGKLSNDLLRFESENSKHKTKINNLLDRVKTSNQIEKQIRLVRKYIKVLEEFVKKQKEQKREILEKTLLEELSKLFNKKGLIDNVELTIHKNNLGLEVKLFDDTGKETSPITDLSKGEQQLYISALLKAILSESIHDLPVLIDTPLGRLDQEHRDNILQHYYPYLSNQVIIFSTNTEVRVSDVPKIEQHLAATYRLENKNKKTIVHEGYFH